MFGLDEGIPLESRNCEVSKLTENVRGTESKYADTLL